MGQMSPAKLRAIGLGTAVAIAVLVPIAATAGPSGGASAPAGKDRAAAGRTTTASGGDDAKPEGLLAELGLAPGRPAPAAAAAPGAPAALPSATRCGPELASPDGVEAQTCVVTEDAGIRARTYYRNATGQELDAVLTLMAPEGRTVQVRCAVAAQDEPGTCETPREPLKGGPEGYSAVSEFAGAGEGDSTPLLLRSGSNAAGPDGS
ncbi:hypothetical protein ACFU3J_31375 [Streptomyces sp. NPDC057411]|uniref:hypothetical protein n=1 Tax=unclassified Streptomyces TaxID=2593676 RepID=UPI00362B5165